MANAKEASNFVLKGQTFAVADAPTREALQAIAEAYENSTTSMVASLNQCTNAIMNFVSSGGTDVSQVRSDLTAMIGSLNALTTTARTSCVAAINSLKTELDRVAQLVHPLDDLVVTASVNQRAAQPASPTCDVTYTLNATTGAVDHLNFAFNGIHA